MTEKKTDTPPKKNILQSIASGIEDGIRGTGNLIQQGGKAVWDGISGGGQMLVDAINKTGEVVVDQTTGAIGHIRDGVFYIGDKAMDGVVMVKDGVMTVGGNVVGTVVNTTKFIGDSEYRNNEGIPWLRGVISANQKTLAYQMQQNGKAMDVLYRSALGEELPQEEKELANKQIADMAKLVPALAIFLLPGGMVLLPTLAKLLPWELVPNLAPPEQIDEDTPVSAEQTTDETTASSSPEK